MEKAAANRTRRRGRRARREDRISKLPEELLHHILCFLDQRTAARTSVLSKPWRYLWCTRPKIDFRHELTVVAGENKELFFSVLERTLRGYNDREFRLQEVTLHLSEYRTAGSFTKTWIPILAQSMGVNKLHLHFISFYISDYKIPLSISIFSSESLRDLSLMRCALQSIPAAPPLHLKHLRKLTLDNVDIPEEILDDILSNCRFLEYVCIARCTGFKRIELKHPASLKEFRLFNYEYRGGTSFAMGDGDIPTLRSIKIEDCLLLFNPNSQFHFSHLTHLKMTNMKVSEESCGLFSCSLPCLEELGLHYCSGIKEFNLSSHSMMRMEISNTNSPFKVTVDAPSIVSFRYNGILPQSISFSAAAASSWKSYVDLTCVLTESKLHLQDLIGLLKALSQSEISIELLETTVCWLRIQVDNSMNVVVDLPLVVDHLIVAETMSIPFLNSLFLVLRPRFIYMNYNKGLAKIRRVTEINLTQRDMVQQLFPRGVSTQVLYWNTDKWIPFEPEILSKLISKKGDSMDETFLPNYRECRIKLVIFDLDRASICYRKFIRNYLALCY